MSIIQISVFMEDKTGKLASITKLLGSNDVNILGFDVADTAEGYGIFRLISNDPEKSASILSHNGYTVSKNEVLCVFLENKPGQLAKCLGILADHGISIEYIYAIVESLIIIKVDSMQSSRKALEDSGIRTLNMQQLLSHVQR